jgi:hypothetical protein
MTPINEFISVLGSRAHKVSQAAGVFLSAAILLALLTPSLPAQGGQAGKDADPPVKFVPVPLRPDLPEPPPLRVPAKISECELGICGVWQFSGDSGNAHWLGGYVATLTVERFGFDGVTIHRHDTSGPKPGAVAVYTGKIIGDQLVGEIQWSWPGHSDQLHKGPFAATIMEPKGFSLIDPDTPCDSPYTIPPKEAANRGVMAIEAHQEETGACWLRRAANAGNAAAQGMLATLEYKGLGVPVNLPEAANLAQKSARQGNYLAERCLSLMYANGKGLPKDAAKAEYWRAKAVKDKSASDQTERQEDQQLAKEQQDARAFQAQQAAGPPQNASAQQRNRQTLQALALLGIVAGGGDDSCDSGDSRTRINCLQSKVDKADRDCRSDPTGRSDQAVEACHRWRELTQELFDARNDAAK